jgi:hypothetical protein
MYLSPQEVADALGDKIMHGLGDIVLGADDDLAEYRPPPPPPGSRASGRGLANWIHDAMRARALALFDGLSNVSFEEREPHFDIYVTTPDRILFRVRLKRHTSTGRIANVRTQGALDFVYQPADLLTELGFKIVHLCVGYEWDSVTRSMSAPVMTLRDGSFEHVVWMADLPGTPGIGGGSTPATPIAPIVDGPKQPSIEVSADTSETQGSADG